jgi:hypothetical protein
MLKVQPEIELGNSAVEEGTLGEIVRSVSDQLNPEAFYAGPVDGTRTLFLVFEIDDSSEIVKITEPFFSKLKAKVEVLPVMNQAEMLKGLAG